MTDSKITNPFEVLDARLARIEDLLVNLKAGPPVQPFPSEPNLEGYVTRREVAKMLDVCLTTVDHLSNAGILRKYRNGRVVRFLRAEVIAAISGNKGTAFFRQPKTVKP